MNQTTSLTLRQPIHFLISPWTDIFLLGLSSLLGFGIIYSNANTFRLLGVHPEILLAINTAVSYPHIIASFFLFYGKRGNWRTSPWVAWILPLILIALLIVAVLREDSDLLLFLGQAGLIYFFWHFLMQAFGSSLWLVNHGMLSPSQFSTYRQFTRFCALGIGLTGWLSLHLNAATENVFSVPLPAFGFPLNWKDWTPGLCGGFLLLHAALCLGLGLRQKSPGLFLTAFLPILALYLWFSPLLIDSPYRLLIPFFHGLQFFAFYVRTQRPPAQTRRTQLIKIVFQWALFAFIGLMLFKSIPSFLEKILYQLPAGTTGRIAAALAIFLNIHHYMVDGTLWTLRNPLNRKRMSLE